MNTIVSMVSTTLAERLRVLREYTGLSARAISDLAGLTCTTHLTKIESGDRVNPTGETLVLIARVFGTTVEWLVTGDGEAPSRLDVCTAVEAAQKRAAEEARAPSPAPRRKPRRSRAAA